MRKTCIITGMILITVRTSTEPTYFNPLLHKMPCFPRRSFLPSSKASVSLFDRRDHVFADMRDSMYEISLVFLSVPAGMERF